MPRRAALRSSASASARAPASPTDGRTTRRSPRPPGSSTATPRRSGSDSPHAWPTSPRRSGTRRRRSSAIDCRPLLAAVRRQQLVGALLATDRCTVRRGDVSWVVDRGRLVDVTISGEVGRALPVDPPEPTPIGRPLRRQQVDEALCLAKYFDRHADGHRCRRLQRVVAVPARGGRRHAAARHSAVGVAGDPR